MSSSWSEADRLLALGRYAVLDTPREPEFDDVVRLAADVFGASVAAVNFIAEGRQWLKAEVGVGVDELPWDASVAVQAVLQPGVLVVPDTALDPCFTSNPLVRVGPGMRFYAGVRLETAEGAPLGALCVLDAEPRPEGVTERQRLTLEVLARQVMTQLELRRAVAQRDAELRRARESEARLRESEARQRAITEATPECIKIVASDGRLLHMNAAGLSMIEAPDAETVQGADTFGLVAPEHRADWRENHARVLGGERLSWEFDIVGLQGGRRRMETHAVPLNLPDGSVAQLAVTRDVTGRKQAEAALKEESRTLETLNRTGAALAAELDVERVVQMVTDAGVELTTAQFGAFFYNVLNDAGESYMLYTLSGVERSAFDRFPMPRATAVFAPTFKGEGVIRSDDILADPRYGRNLPRKGMPEGHLPVRSYLAVPVVSRSGEVIGGLFFGHSEVARFTERHERLMVGIAAQAAVAIDNARLYQAAQRELAERREAEARLRKSEAQFRTALNAVPQMVWSARPDGHVEFYNERWYEFVGAEPGATDGQRWNEVVHPDDRERAATKWRRSLLTGEPYEIEYRLRHWSGDHRWALARGLPVRDENGRLVSWMGTCTDIQELVEAREAAARAAEDLERRVEAAVAERDRIWTVSDDLLAVATLDGRFVSTSPAWERVLGWSADELRVRPLLDLVHPDDRRRTQEDLSRLARGQRTLTFENRCRTKDGHHRWLSWTAAPEGRLMYTIGRDVTQEKAREAELDRAREDLHQIQKLETIGQLTGGVAHDFNNLLTPIVGGLDILRRRRPDERDQRLISGALQSAERAKTLVQRLLAFARRQHLEARPVDAGALVLGMRDLIDRSLGPAVEVAIQVEGDPPPAYVDPNQLELAILNLAVNARDAMPGGGRLTISVGAEALDPPHKARLAAGTYVRISVSDTGVGMDEGTLARAVEPFFSTKGVGKGTGLGLSMVHGLARQSGGALLLDSAPGRGTTARLYLPVALEADAGGDAPEEHDRVTPAASLSILLVDDEELVRQGTAEMLADLGHRVIQAGSGAAALEAVRADAPDLLITDYAMPGMTGTELAAEARRLSAGLPVLLITGFADLSDSKAGGLPRLPKPFRQSALAARIAEVVRPPRDPRPLRLIKGSADPRD